MEGERFHEYRQPAPSFMNRSMLTPKLFNLLYGACLTSLMPFLPMLFRFLGLTAFQNGILGCLRSLVSFWSSVVWCVLAEKFGKRKCLLVLFLLVAIVLNISLGLVHNSNANFGSYTCSKGQELKNSSARSATFPRKPEDDRDNQSFKYRNIPHKNPEGLPGTSVTNTIQLSTGTVFQPYGNVLTSEASNLNKRPISRDLASTYNSSHANLYKTNNSKQVNKTEIQEYVFHMFGFRMDVTFQTLLILTVVAEFFVSPVRHICESIFADILHCNKGTTNRSMVWVTLGNMLGAGLVILVIGHYRCSFSLTNTFYLHFYLYAFFGAGAFIFASLFHVYEPKTSMSFRFGRTCKFVSCDLHILSFLSILFVLGVAESLVSNFMMWYLQDIKASIPLMGLILAFVAFSELLTNFLSPYFVRWFGHQCVIGVALLAYGGRLLCYSYISDPWLILPVQLLHGISYTSVWTACSSYSALVAPIGMERTLNSIMSITFWGFGHGVGGIGVALLYYQYGSIVVFRCAAGVCGVYCLLYAVLQFVLVIPGDSRSHGKLTEYRQITFDDTCKWHKVNSQEDWLLEALEAEDEDTHYARQK